MTYSIFDSTGNLVDSFAERGAALDCLASIAQAEPAAADDVYLVAQDDAGNIVGETVYASSVSVRRRRTAVRAAAHEARVRA